MGGTKTISGASSSKAGRSVQPGPSSRFQTVIFVAWDQFATSYKVRAHTLVVVYVSLVGLDDCLFSMDALKKRSTTPFAISSYFYLLLNNNRQQISDSNKREISMIPFPFFCQSVVWTSSHDVIC